MNLDREHKNLIIEMAKDELASVNRNLWMNTNPGSTTDPKVIMDGMTRRNQLIRIISECNN